MLNIPLSKPDISDLEHQYVSEVLDSNRLAMGPRLRSFEARMADRCGTRHAIAVSSGTAALHLTVVGLGLGKGDEVITTPFSFVASSNVVLYEGALPRFVDISPTTYLLDPARVEQAVTAATRAILGVDIFGLPVDWPALTEIARTHNLYLIDDACHALGAEIDGRPIGSWGDAATFGFYPNKQITTGEGGCITTNSDKLAARCRSLRNQGRAEDSRMEHIRLGYNYRMSELSAALGCAQMERFSELLAQRTQVAAWYDDALAPLQQELLLPFTNSHATRSWFVYVIRLENHYAAEARDMLMALLREQGIGCAPYFPSIHLQPYYRRTFGFKPGDFPLCEAVSARTLALPFFGSLTQGEVHHVAKAVKIALPKLPCLGPSVSFNVSGL
ncbi:MAG: DegT/DnrJ/EryC1/StrS family aminotransferase [Rhodothermales bacterium]